MSEKIIAIANEVVEQLNGQSFTQPFTATRAFVPDYELRELAALKVTVVPKAIDLSLVNRIDRQKDYSIDIGVQRKVASDSDIEALMGLSGEIEAFLASLRRLPTSDVYWVSSNIQAVYDAEHLDKRVFTSVVTVTYRDVTS